MIIRSVCINNFRGIAELNWHIRDRFVVLVGPGDAGKTTVFEAIDLCLGRQWYSPTDADFYNGDHSKTIVIDVTVGDLPEGFLDLHNYGNCLRGWTYGQLHDEPEPGDESVVTVRLSIDGSLEPVWTLANDRVPDGVHVRSVDRAKLGLHRLGSNVDHQLGWGRGSLLTKLSDSNAAIQGILGHVARKIREATARVDIEGIREAVAKATEVAERIGVSVDDLNPAISAADLSLGGSLLVLHDGKVPVRQMGLGSRRLLAIGIELDAIEGGGIGIVDEIEHGLEPYRIHNLLTAIRTTIKATPGQALLTTHSPEVIKDCGAEFLHVVRNDGSGRLSITPIVNSDEKFKNTLDQMQRLVRTTPEALLARKVVVCEGKTEYGIVRGLDSAWIEASRPSLSSQGCVPINGAGNSKAACSSILLHGLGYQVCFFGDSDKDPTPSWADLVAAGINVIRWKEPLAIEDAVFMGMPWSDVVHILSAIGENKDKTFFKNHATDKAITTSHDWEQSVSLWSDGTELRQALALMAKKTPSERSSGHESDAAHWIKDIPIGEFIGRRMAANVQTLETEHDIRIKVEQLRRWIDLSDSPAEVKGPPPEIVRTMEV